MGGQECTGVCPQVHEKGAVGLVQGFARVRDLPVIDAFINGQQGQELNQSQESETQYGLEARLGIWFKVILQPQGRVLSSPWGSSRAEVTAGAMPWTQDAEEQAEVSKEHTEHRCWAETGRCGR